MTSVAAELEGFRALSCALRLWELCKELFCFKCFFANWRGLEQSLGFRAPLGMLVLHLGLTAAGVDSLVFSGSFLQVCI